MKQLLFTKGPQGPIGATLGTAMNNFYSSPNKVSTHYITWPFSWRIWRRWCLKFAWFWPFGALPLGPHGGHTYDLNNFESPTPKDDSCQVWLKSNYAFSRRRWKCKKFTDDARRTKTDGNSSLEPSAQVSYKKKLHPGWKTIKYKEIYNFGTKKITLYCLEFVIQWNLVIKRSDITKPSYNKIILLVPALYIPLFFYPDMMRTLI